MVHTVVYQNYSKKLHTDINISYTVAIFLEMRIAMGQNSLNLTELHASAFFRSLTFLLKMRTAALSAGLLAMAPALADGPLRGNPVDAMPRLENPAPRAPGAPVALPPTPEQQAVQARLAQRIVPSRFDVAGVRALPFAEVSALLQPLAGKDTTVGELARQVNRITELYRERGYVLSFALLQNQDFAQGVVAVTVVEGHVDRVRVEGEIGAAAARLQTLGRPLVEEKPLTRATLERQLNLMRRVPGVRIAPSLDMPRRADGATELVLAATRRAVSATGGVADMGTGAQGLVNLSANSLTPLGEQVRLTTAIPTGYRDVRYFAGEVTVPVGADGLAVKLDGYAYRARPEDDGLEFLGYQRAVRNERAGVGLSYPLLLDNRRSLTGTAGVYAAHSRDRYTRDADGLAIEQDVRVRAARAELRYVENGEKQSRDVTLAVARGFDAMGARQSLANNRGVSVDPGLDLDFTRYNLNLRQTLALPAGFGLVLSGAGQFSDDVLPSSEQISFGGFRYAMGYPQGDQGGDKGFGASLEVNRRIPLGLGRYLNSVQPYLLADYARTWYNNDALQAQNDRHLSSLAAGLRISDDRYYLLDVNVAKPVGSRPFDSDDRGWRVNANYSLYYDAF